MPTWQQEKAEMMKAMSDLRALIVSPPQQQQQYPPRQGNNGNQKGKAKAGGGGAAGGKGSLGAIMGGGRPKCLCCGMKHPGGKASCWYKDCVCPICDKYGHTQPMCNNAAAIAAFNAGGGGQKGGGGKTGPAGNKHVRGTVQSFPPLPNGAVPKPVVPPPPAAFVSWLCPVQACRKSGGTQFAWSTHCEECGIKRPQASRDRAKKEAAAAGTLTTKITHLIPSIEKKCAEALDEEDDDNEEGGDDEQADEDREGADFWQGEEVDEDTAKLARLQSHLAEMEAGSDYSTEEIAAQKEKIEAIPRAAKTKALSSQKAISDHKVSLTKKHNVAEAKLQTALEAAKAAVNLNVKLRKEGLINLKARYDDSVRAFHAEYDQFDTEAETLKVKAQDAVNDADSKYEASMARMNEAYNKLAGEEAPDYDGFGMTVGSMKSAPMGLLRPGVGVVTSDTLDNDVVREHLFSDQRFANSGITKEVMALVAASMGTLLEDHGWVVPTTGQEPVQSKVAVRKAAQQQPWLGSQTEQHRAASQLQHANANSQVPASSFCSPAEQQTRMLLEQSALRGEAARKQGAIMASIEKANAKEAGVDGLAVDKTEKEDIVKKTTRFAKKDHLKLTPTAEGKRAERRSRREQEEDEEEVQQLNPHQTHPDLEFIPVGQSTTQFEAPNMFD